MTPQALMQAALDRKCIVGFHNNPTRMPAAFVVNMNFHYVMQRLKTAQIYKPKTKTPNEH